MKRGVNLERVRMVDKAVNKLMLAGVMIVSGILPPLFTFNVYLDDQAVFFIVMLSGISFALGWFIVFTQVFVLTELRNEFKDRCDVVVDVDEPFRGRSGNVAFMQATQAARPAVVRPSRQSIQIKLSRFEFEPNEWHMILNAVRKNRWKWTLEPLRKTGLFTVPKVGLSITASGAWNLICDEFARLDYITGSSGNWILTEDGREALLILSSGREHVVFDGRG